MLKKSFSGKEMKKGMVIKKTSMKSRNSKSTSGTARPSGSLYKLRITTVTSTASAPRNVMTTLRSKVVSELSRRGAKNVKVELVKA